MTVVKIQNKYDKTFDAVTYTPSPLLAFSINLSTFIKRYV